MLTTPLLIVASVGALFIICGRWGTDMSPVESSHYDIACRDCLSEPALAGRS